MPSRSVSAVLALGFAAGMAIAPSAACARPVSPCGEAASRPWCDASLPSDRRAELLLQAMTLGEKLDLMSGDDLVGAALATTDESRHVGTLRGVPRLGIPTIYFADGPVGVRQGSGTALPAPLSLAATFDPGAARRSGALVGDEARLKGNQVVHGPAVDVMRDGRWGRAFESYGEDPFLSAALGVQWIKGLQEQGVMADVKHFPVYTQETHRFTMENVVAPRVEREIHLPPFEAAVRDGGAATVMCAYPRTNGEDSCGSRAAIERILRGEWGFRGFVLSDYVFAVRDTKASVRNGLDLEMPVGRAYNPLALRGLLAAGTIDQATIDGRVSALLRTLFGSGVFDRAPYTNDGSRIDYAAHAKATESLSEGGITLLKNSGGILPLSPSRVKSIAIIGWPADTYHKGGGSSDVRPRSVVTPRQGITARAGAGVKVTYTDGRDAAAARKAAASADVALVFAADSRTEGTDLGCLSLRCSNTATPVRDPDRLIDQVAAANPRTVVVLETGGPVLTPWAGRVEGIVEAWYPGQHGGTALARVLFGDADPGGRLPVTFPVGEKDPPTADDRRRYPGADGKAVYSEGVLTGYRHYDARGLRPAFPFGHGLSYTRFAFRDLTVRSTGAGRATVAVTVVNTGPRPGVSVPQLYVGLPAPDAATPQPPRQLKGFNKIALEPGQRRRVTFTLGARELSYWSEAAHKWRIAPGCYRVTVGTSSRNAAATGAFAQGGRSC